MKNIFGFIAFFAVTLGFTLTGCTSNDVYTPEEIEQDIATSAPITGKLYVSGTSRANAATVEKTIIDNGFEAYIYKVVEGKREVVFSGHVAVANDKSFTITNTDKTTVNWEKNQTLYICAYYVPSGAGYEVSDDVIFASSSITGSGDVMVAYFTDTYTTTVPSLSLQFKHITAQVSATVAAPDDVYDYVLDAIKFTVNIKADHGQEGTSSYTIGANTPSWTSTLYNIPLYLVGSETAGATENDDPVLVSYNTSATYGTPLSINEMLFLIPTAVTGSETNLTLAVSYTVKDKTSGVVRQDMTTLQQNFAVAIGSNTKFNITLPILPAIGGSLDPNNPIANWVVPTDANVDITF